MAVKVCFASAAERDAFKAAHPEVRCHSDIEYLDYTKIPSRITSWCTHYDGILVTPTPPPVIKKFVLRGAVKSTTGAAIPAATVTAYNKTATTDLFGNYRLEYDAGWSGPVKVTAPGYSDATGTVSLTAAETVLNFTMTPVIPIAPPVPVAPPVVPPVPPVETALRKKWREFHDSPDVVKWLGILPDLTMESFTRVFSNWSYIDDAPRAPEWYDYVGVGGILAGVSLLGIAGVSAAIAAIPAVGSAGMMAGSVSATLATPKVAGAAAKIMGWATAHVSLKSLIGAAVGLLGTDTFVKFIGEEAVQTAGMGVWVLISAKDWKGAKAALEKYRVFISHLKAEVDLVGYLNPIAYGSFKNYYEAAEMQAAAYEDVINKNLGTAEAKLPEKIRSNVRDILDGDTIDVSMSAYDAVTGSAVPLPEYRTTKHARVRLLGINAPEKSPKGEIVCSDVEIFKVEAKYADESRMRLMPLNEKDVILKIDSAKPADVYSRILAVVEYAGENINLRQVKEGLACGYYPEPNKWVDQALFKSETLKAQAAGIGMWAGEQAGPAAKPAFKILIDSEPTRAKLYIDGVYTKHLTPSDQTELKDVLYMLKPGPHVIRVEKAGMAAERSVEIVEGDNGTIMLTLGVVGLAPVVPTVPGVPVPPVPVAPVEVFKIYIDSEPTRAKLHVDGVYTKHLTPSDEKELKDVMHLLAPGPHTLMATKAGMVAEQGVNIVEGDNGRIMLTLGTVGLPPAEVPVVPTVPVEPAVPVKTDAAKLTEMQSYLIEAAYGVFMDVEKITEIDMTQAPKIVAGKLFEEIIWAPEGEVYAQYRTLGNTIVFDTSYWLGRYNAGVDWQREMRGTYAHELAHTAQREFLGESKFSEKVRTRIYMLEAMAMEVKRRIDAGETTSMWPFEGKTKEQYLIGP